MQGVMSWRILQTSLDQKQTQSWRTSCCQSTCGEEQWLTTTIEFLWESGFRLCMTYWDQKVQEHSNDQSVVTTGESCASYFICTS